MHELAIAESLVRIAEAHAGGRRVALVEVKVGHLRQVVPSSLAFSFELVAAGTLVEGAKLTIEEVSAAGRCRDCGVESELPGFPLSCGACGGLDVEITGGEELLVDALELQELEGASATGSPGQAPRAPRESVAAQPAEPAACGPSGGRDR